MNRESTLKTPAFSFDVIELEEVTSMPQELLLPFGPQGPSESHFKRLGRTKCYEPRFFRGTLFPLLFGGCATKNCLPKTGFPFFPRTEEQNLMICVLFFGFNEAGQGNQATAWPLFWRPRCSR